MRVLFLALLSTFGLLAVENSASNKCHQDLLKVDNAVEKLVKHTLLKSDHVQMGFARSELMIREGDMKEDCLKYADTICSELLSQYIDTSYSLVKSQLSNEKSNEKLRFYGLAKQELIMTCFPKNKVSENVNIDRENKSTSVDSSSIKKVSIIKK